MTKPLSGISEQHRIIEWLKVQLPSACVTSAHYNSPFDVVVNGKRVEIKVSTFHEDKGGWFFNIHRHGKIDESNVDFYLLCLKSQTDIFVLRPSPTGKLTILISKRSLKTMNTGIDKMRGWEYSEVLPEWTSTARSRGSYLSDEEAKAFTSRLQSLIGGHGSIIEMAKLMGCDRRALYHMTEGLWLKGKKYRPGKVWALRLKRLESILKSKNLNQVPPSRRNHVL